MPYIGVAGMAIHDVKSWPKFFSQIIAGRRHHELRLNDRKYKVGDVLRLFEFDPDVQRVTGRMYQVVITSITSASEACAVSAEALHPDYCILSIDKISNHYDLVKETDLITNHPEPGRCIVVGCQRFAIQDHRCEDHPPEDP